MDKDRLAELTSRAEKATNLAIDIQRLQKANPRQGGLDLRFRPDGTNSMAEFLEWSMLIDVIERGCRSLIADKEAEIEALLGTDKQPEISVSVVPLNLAPISMPEWFGREHDKALLRDQEPKWCSPPDWSAKSARAVSSSRASETFIDSRLQKLPANSCQK